MAVIDELKILVTAEVSKAISELDRTEKQTKKTGDSFGDFAKKVAGYTTGMNLAVDATKKIITGMFNLAKESLSVASGIERTQMEFGVLLGDLNLGTQAFEEMNGLAAETPLALNDITSAGKQLLSVGISANEITDKIRMLGDVAMGDAGKLGQLTSAFAQLKSKGVASMEQINRFTEAGIPIIKELATNFGVTEKEVFNLVSTGKVGFKDVEGALKTLTSEGGLYHDMMKQVAETTAGKWSTAQDNFRMALGRIGEEALPAVNKALDAFNKLMDKSAASSKAFKEFHRYITTGTTDQVDAASALSFALDEVVRAESRRVGLNSRLAGAGDQAVKDAQAVVDSLGKAAYWQGLALKGSKDQAATDAKAAEDKAKAEADALARAEKAKQNAEAALKNIQEMDKAYEEWGEEVVALYGASSLLNPLFEETLSTTESIQSVWDKISKANSDALGDQIVMNALTAEWADEADGVEYIIRHIADALTDSIEEAKVLGETLSSTWSMAGDTFSAYADLVANGYDAEIAALEETKDAMEERGEDTTAIEEKISAKKNELAEKEFNANKLSSIADATISGAVAAVKALELGPIAGPIAAAVIAGLTATQVGMIGAQQYVPYASGGFVDQPTHALVGEAGSEWILNKAQMAGLAKNGISGGGTTIVQNISGSIWSTKSLESMAVSAQAKASRGF